MKPGDLVAFETRGLFAWWIRLGQRRFLKCRNWEYTHVAIVEHVDPDGAPWVIQAVRKVDRVFVNAPQPIGYLGIPQKVLTAPPGLDRTDVVRFAQSCLGRKYGALSVLSRALNCITPKAIQIDVNRAGRMDCSTFASRAWEHGGLLLPWPDPWQVSPGQLVDCYG